LVTPGSKTRAKQRHEAGLLETLLVGPLPFIFELGDIRRLIVRGVEVMHSGGEAGVP